jgi:hypothetical protein
LETEAVVADSEVAVRIIEDQFPKAARHLLGPEIHCRAAGVQVVAEAAEGVAGQVAVAVEAVEHPVVVDVQSGTGCYTG